MPCISHLTVPVGQLSHRDRQQMLALMQTYYLGVTREQFEGDLAEKEHVMILRQSGVCDAIVGFSTLRLVDLEVGGQIVKAVFSGDTIVERNSRCTFGMGVELARYFYGVLEENPDIEVYYILISKGWQTSRIPALLFREYSPSHHQPTLARHQQVMDAFGAKKYPHNYLPERGLIAFLAETQRLKPGTPEAQVPPRDDPDVDLFLKKNPNYLEGDELVYVASVSPGNFSRAMDRFSSKHPEAQLAN